MILMRYTRLLIATMVLTTALFGAFATPVAAAGSQDPCDDYDGWLGWIEDRMCTEEGQEVTNTATGIDLTQGGGSCSSGNCLEYKTV